MYPHVKSWHTASAVPREWHILRWSDKKPAEAFEICTGVCESGYKWSWITIIQCTSVVVRIDISLVSWTGMRIWILRSMGRRCTCDRWNLYIGRTCSTLFVCLLSDFAFRKTKIFLKGFRCLNSWITHDIKSLRSDKWNACQDQYV